ncbi:MAG: hypothetical protein OXE55_05430 [Flavobacteriaceae bacterium]|nr:hypothetical protein [Flavobacteriaceae bacterium]
MKLHPVQIAHWKSTFDKKAPMVFHRSGDVARWDQKKEDRSLKIIGPLKVENEFIKKTDE